jgi:hypothetical protein
MKNNFMKTFIEQVPESVKIAVVVLFVYGLIALITYLVW